MKKLLFFAMLLFLFNCKHNDSNNDSSSDNLEVYVLKDRDSTLIIRGSYIDNKRIGDWELFNLDNQIVTIASYDENSSIRIKKIKYYNTVGKLIAVESHYSNNEIVMDYITHFTNDTIKNLLTGKYLFKEYCSSCHSIDKKIIAKPFKELFESTLDKSFVDLVRPEILFNKINLANHEDFRQKLSKAELEDVMRFVLSKKFGNVP